jgi:pimeloyl-ACP methyl ester carboxylesterase
METVKSADGTVIAFDRTGDGPVLIVSLGALCTRHTFVPPEALTQRFAVITYDRRGRGDSGDTQPYAPEREFDDITALAAATGSEPPFVFGHSSGAAIALRAAAAGMPTAGIVAYEAPFTNEDTPRPSVDPVEHIRELVSAGRNRDAIIFWMSDIARAPKEAVAQMEGAPWVTAMEPLAAPLLYDLALTANGIPVAELSKIATPVLIAGGKNSPAWFQRSVAEQAAATPGAQLKMLDGYDHVLPPEVSAQLVLDFTSGIAR